MTRTSFSNAAFARLVRRLRRTNARYDRIAHQIRCRIRHTYHAKRRAYWAGLRIDTSKARACPAKYISTQPPPVLDRSPAYIPAVGASSLPASAAHIPHSETGVGLGNTPRDAYMRGLRLHERCREGHEEQQCNMLHLNVDYGAAEAPSHQEPVPVPSAPRLTPKQLPEDEWGTEVVFESSAVDTPESHLSTPPTGLCIIIPPRNLKRKLRDIEAEEGAMLSHQPRVKVSCLADPSLAS